MIQRFLNVKTKSIAFGAGILAASALFSRLLGLFRDNLLANLFNSNQTDVYFAAFRVPDFIYGILITGGIVAAFLPVFTDYFKKGEDKAKELVNNVLTFFLFLLIFISAILALFSPQIIKFITPGFSQSQKALTVILTRIMFLSPILLGLSAIFSGILQYFNLFFAYALAPIFYNFGIIIGILFLVPIFGLKGLAFGVILGALSHLLIQLPPAFKSGFRPRLSFRWDHPGLKKIFRLMLPRVFGSATYHLNLIIITAIASTLAAGSISIFNFSNNLGAVPIGLIGLSFATASFPLLSRHAASDEKRKFLDKFSSIFSKILFLAVPVSFFVFLLRSQLVRIILGTSILGNGLFGWLKTRLTAASLGIFALSLGAACLIPLLSRAFFAYKNTKTPVGIAISAMALNIFLCYFFVWLLSFNNVFRSFTVSFLKLKGIKDISVLGLPYALFIAAFFQFFLLLILLRKKIIALSLKKIIRSFLKIFIAALCSSFLVYFGLQIGAMFLNTRSVVGIISQMFFAVGLGAASYIFLSFLLKSKEQKEISSLIFSRFKTKLKS